MGGNFLFLWRADFLNSGLLTVGSTKTWVDTQADGIKELVYSSDISNLKSSVSNGKSAIASAITDKGVSTSSDADFSTMASNIRSVNTARVETTQFYDYKLGDTFRLYSTNNTTLQWQCVHIDDNIMYAILLYPLSTSGYGGVNSSTATSYTTTTYFYNSNGNIYSSYTNSTLLYNVIKNFSNTFNNIQLVDVAYINIRNTVSLAFAPTYEQMNGEFEYFNSDASRKAYLGSNQTVGSAYWTSGTNSSNSCWYVDSNGKLSEAYSTTAVYIRPCLALLRYRAFCS